MLRLQWSNFTYLGERHACVLKVFMALVQVYLVVRSFADAEAYLHTNWYARVANREYPSDVSATETDFESHFTVACYDADPAVSGAQVKKVPSLISVPAPYLPTIPSCDAHLILNSNSRGMQARMHVLWYVPCMASMHWSGRGAVGLRHISESAADGTKERGGV